MRTTLLAIWISALLASTAQAGWRVDRAQRIAAVVWHHPCAGRVVVAIGPTHDRADGARVEAYADVPNCTIHFDALGPAHDGRPWSWQMFCNTMLHEYGHLAGYRDPTNGTDPMHSRNADSVMYASSYYDNIDGRCAQRGRPFLRAHRAF